MIESIKHKGLRCLFEDGDTSKVSADMVEKIEVILSFLDAANVIEDINQPYFRIHQLKQDLKGLWSVTVRANWRIVFRFDDGKAFDVDLVDYH